jgi:hypothetical protein
MSRRPDPGVQFAVETILNRRAIGTGKTTGAGRQHK